MTRTVTTRHLLSHTSGIDGDLFLDTGRGDDCLEKYVAAMADLKQNHPLGATMSYCNSGYILLGRLIEVVRGKTWDTVLRDNLFAPLGLTSAGTLPEEALLYGAATGHVEPPGADDPVVTPQWGIYRSCGPAGLIHMTATDLLAFARLHLDGGVTKDGTRILSETSLTAMQKPEVDIPDRWTLADQWGLGWFLMDWNGRKVYGHDGATLGQGGFLRILPDTGLSVSLLANGGHMRELFTDLFSEVFSAPPGLETRPRPTPPENPDHPAPPAYAAPPAPRGRREAAARRPRTHPPPTRPPPPPAQPQAARDRAAPDPAPPPAPGAAPAPRQTARPHPRPPPPSPPPPPPPPPPLPPRAPAAGPAAPTRCRTRSPSSRQSWRSPASPSASSTTARSTTPTPA